MTSMRVYTDNHLTAEPWRTEGLCLTTDPDAFFPARGDHAGRRRAIDICNSCPVIEPCRVASLSANEHFGISGGMTPADRRRILKGRNT